MSVILVIVLMAAAALNIPFGFYRQGVPKFSLKWFLSIHLPVPAIYFLRQSTGTGAWAIPLMIIFSVLGQIAGGKIRIILARSFKIAAK